MDRLRIGFLTDKCAPFYVGGYEDRIWNLADRLGQENDVVVATSLSCPSVRMGGVNFRRCSTTAFQAPPPADRSLMHSALYSFSLRSNPFRGRPLDVLIIESIPYLHLRTVAKWVRAAPFKRVLDVNEAWSSYSYLPGVLEHPSNWAIRNLLLTGISWADMVVSVSWVTKQSLEHAYQARDVRVIPMGLDHQYVAAHKPRGGSIPIYDFVMVGRLVRIKRIHEFLLALSILRTRASWSGRAAIIGDGPLRADLENLAVELGIGPQVTFMGMASNEEKFRTLHESRIFVLCSEREGFSLATLEAMACGVPPVVARPIHKETFGVSDFVTVGQNGEGYPMGNVGALADILQNLLDDESRRLRLGNAAREMSGSYDWREISACFEADLRELCSDP